MKLLIVCITGYLFIGLIVSIILSFFGMLDRNIALVFFVLCIGMIFVNREIFKNDRPREEDSETDNK